ncbi:hypothetical protein YIM_07210 [Amycolatopsis sp. YIM 10]|nr:hypothetical protein YIM_07210 [Amycolatopsis sp. YIM 10]
MVTSTVPRVSYTAGMLTSSRRDSIERESEIVLSLISTGLVRMQDWGGVHDRQLPYDGNLQRGLDRLTVACLRAGSKDRPRGVRELVLNWCSTRQLGTWPLTFTADAQVDGELLVIDGRASEFCQEWAVAAQDVAAELHESILVRQVKEAADALGRHELYAEWRVALARHAVVAPAEMLALKNRFPAVPQWAAWIDDSYEPIPPEATRLGDVGVCAACRQWMVPDDKRRWACLTWRCTRAHSVPAPMMVAAHGARRLRPELVKPIALPARPELALAEALAARGARVVLYPELDALDLIARWPNGFAVAIDVKDWRKPYLLARNIKRFPAWPPGHLYHYDRACVVVPADRVRPRSRYCEIVAEHSPALQAQRHIDVLTDEELIKQTPDTGIPGEVTCGP